MKPVFQTRFDVGGNCYQAALASLLELPLEAVPDPSAAMLRSAEDGSDWMAEVTQWLRDRGLGHACWPSVQYDAGTGHRRAEVPPARANVVVFTTGVKPAGWSLLGGRSPRGPYGHSVVCFDGELAHDPFPAGGGVITQEDWEIVYPLDLPAVLRQLR
jgi:hypothetical protein